jgi:hypothetical protein
MTVETSKLASLIHATPTKAVLYITGGGTDVLPLLLNRGGGSATLLSARVPYANEETIELLGGTPVSCVRRFVQPDYKVSPACIRRK